MERSGGPVRQSSIRAKRNVTRSFSTASHTRRTSLESAYSREQPATRSEPSGRSRPLTKSNRYVLTRYPGFPAILQNLRHSEMPTGGEADAKTGYGLVVSDQACYVWNYHSSEKLPEMLTFSLNGDNDETIAVLVAKVSGSQEPGLVTVGRRSGIVKYWETVGGAVADTMLHRNKSAEHKVDLHGDTVEIVRAADPAGVILATAAGRFILVTLLDLHGRQHIRHTTMTGVSSGLLASLKSTFSLVPDQRDVVSIKLGATQSRIERQVLFVNSHADISVWTVSRSGHSSVHMRHNFKEAMLAELEGLYPGARHSLVVHDIAVHESKELLFVLASFKHSRTQRYYVTFTFQASVEDPRLLATRRLQTYMGTSTEPKLVLPRPYHTLFVVFPDAVVMLDSYTVQKADHSVARRWEDIVSLKQGVSIIGASPHDGDDASEKCGVVLLVEKGGVLFLERTPENETKVSGSADRRLSSMTAAQRDRDLEYEFVKSRIEQAIYYGRDDDGSDRDLNAVDFHVRDEMKVNPESMERAFLEVSAEIITSTSPYMPTMLPSAAEFLLLRQSYLTRLAHYLQTNCTVKDVSPRARFALLSDVEKASTAVALCSHADSTNESPGKTLHAGISSIVNRVSHDADELVRQWLLQNTRKVGDLLAASLSSVARQQQSVSAAVDGNGVLLSLHDAALAVRAQLKGPVYGLADHISEDEPWTSSSPVLDAVRAQFEAAKRAFEAATTDNADTRALRSQLVSLVETLCELHKERLDWLASSNGSSNELSRLADRYDRERQTWIKFLVDNGHKEAATRIAEHFGIFWSLACIVGDDWSDAVRAGDRQLAEAHHAKLRLYLDEFGYDFAAVLYQYWADTAQLKTLLTEIQDHKDFLRRFFVESRQERISWIFDIANADYTSAAKSLESLSNAPSTVLDDKRVQLSISKLAVVAAGPKYENELLGLNSRLQVLNIQNALDSQLRLAFHGDINADPETLDLGEVASVLSARNSPAFGSVLKRNLARAARREVLSTDDLIDTLTLLDSTTSDAKANFYRAFKLVSLSAPQGQDVNIRLVWLRLLLADDWKSLSAMKSNAKAKTATEKTALFKTLSLAIEDGDADRPVLSPEVVQYIFRPQMLSLSIDELRGHYPYADKGLLGQLQSELERDVAAVSALVANHSLGSWVQGTYSSACVAHKVMGKFSADSAAFSDA